MTTKHHPNRSNAHFAGNPVAPTRSNDTEVAVHRPNAAPVVTSFGVLISHVTWFVAGPLALLLTLLGIVNAGTGWATVLDALFFAIVGLMVWCRWRDQRSGQGTTSDGKPSIWADFRRYVLWMPVVAVAAWIVANVIGNHFLTMWSG